MATLNTPLTVERVPQVYQKAFEMTTPGRHPTWGVQPGKVENGRGSAVDQMHGVVDCDPPRADAEDYGKVNCAVLLSRLVSGNGSAASTGFTVKVRVPPGIQR